MFDRKRKRKKAKGAKKRRPMISRGSNREKSAEKADRADSGLRHGSD